MPDRVGEQVVFRDLVEGGEVEEAPGACSFGLLKHVAQPSFAGRDDDPAPAAVSEPLFVLLRLEVGQPGEDLLAQEAGIILGAAVDLQQVADAEFGMLEDEEAVRDDLAFEVLSVVGVGDLVRVRPELAFRDPGLHRNVVALQQGFLQGQPKIYDGQIVVDLEPARFLPPAEFLQRQAMQTGDQVCTAAVEPVDHLGKVPAPGSGPVG